MNLSQKFDEIKRYGIVSIFYEMLHSAINRLFFFKNLQGMIVTLDTVDHKFLDVPTNFKYTFLTDDEIVHYAKDEANQMKESFIKEALSKGDKCFGITDNDDLVSYGWYSDSETRINDDLLLCFDSSWIYMYKGYTKESHRGQRLHAYAMAMALRAFTDMGKKGLISYVETQNFRSLRSTDRMGYQHFGKVLITKLFNRFWIKTEKSCLPYGFGVREIKHTEIAGQPIDSTLS